jgi:hypothetical protein
MTANLTNLNDDFKQMYSENPPEELMYTDRPLYGMLSKETSWQGANASTRAFAIPILWENNAAVGGSFSVAQAAALRNVSKLNAFQLTSVQAFGFASIDSETMKRSETDKGAFMDVAKMEIDGVHNALANRLHQNGYGNGTGVIGAVSNATFSTSVLTLANPEDSVHFSVGDELIFAQTASSSQRALGSNGTGLLVIAVDRDAGTVTSGNTSGNAVNINDSTYGCPTVSQNDVIFHRGEQNNVLIGLEGFNPQTAPASNDSFFNMNRSQDPSRLAGSRLDGTSYSIEEAIIRGSNKVAKQNGVVKEAFLNFKKYSDLVLSLGAKREYVEVGPEDMPSVGYEAVKVIGARGTINVIPDQACPSNRIFLTNLSKLKLVSVGEPVQVEDSDGNYILRRSDSNVYECRLASYSNIGSWSPRDACNIQVAI